MKKSLSLFLFLMLCSVTQSFAAEGVLGKTTLSGKVTDKLSGISLPGVTIYLPDLKTGTATDADGNYLIENLPQRRVLVQITYIGYKMIMMNVDLSSTDKLDLMLEESVNELHEVVITGLVNAREMNRTPSPIAVISKMTLLEGVSTNIIDAIAREPGVSQVSTGVGISKPVIRGLGYNRVVTVNDGIRQEGQQWGDEHGIEIDEFGVGKIEILKGPASLMFGSDALAGVIHFISAPTLPNGRVVGNILMNYQTNNGLIGYSANLAGNVKGFIWDLRYSNKMAHAYQNKYDGFILNSGFKENAFTSIVGLNKSWGYAHLHISYYDINPGIIEGERDPVTGKLVHAIALNDSTESMVPGVRDDFFNYEPAIPFQKIKHLKAVSNNSLIIGKGTLQTTFGFQQNHRQEFGFIQHPDQYGLYFLLNSFHYEAKYILEATKHFNFSFGVNGMTQHSQNKGSEFLVPAYSLFDIGSFAITSAVFGKLDVSGGVRYDVRKINGDELLIAGEPVFNAFTSTFTGVSGSLGATYQLSETVYGKINFAKGFRSPNISELGSNGVHEGTSRYELGDPSLKAEQSFQLDGAIGLNASHVTGELDLFRNQIQHFIFPQKLESLIDGDSISQGLTSFKYVAGNAILIGGEISADIHPHPLDWLHFENSFSYVLARQIHQPDSLRYLPSTPAAKLSSEIRVDTKKIGKHFSNSYARIEFVHYFEQQKIFFAFGTETSTPSYSLINLGVGTEITSSKGTLCSIYFTIDNVTDEAYQSHLSRLKYTDVNVVTGRNGVFNMGRNFSVKVMVPINFTAY